MNKKEPKLSKGQLRILRLKKNLPLIILMIAVLVLLLAWLKPNFSKEVPILEEPKISMAIVEYCNTQMNKDLLHLPPEALNPQVEQVLIHELTDLPGPQGIRRALTTVKGTYLLADSNKTDKRSDFTIKKMRFKISRKYPEGISVQIDTIN